MTDETSPRRACDDPTCADADLVERVVAVVPALDEEPSVAGVVGALMRFGVARVIVVDNGSRDATAERALSAGARVVSEPRRGYGRACRAGVAAAAAEQPSVVVFADADGCDVLDDLPTLLAPVLSGRLDLVVGARRAVPPLPWHVRAGNRAAVAWLRVAFGARYTDLGPLRAVRWPALQRLGMSDVRCGWTVEMQARAALRGLACGEVEVRYVPRRSGSKISGSLRGSAIAALDIVRTLYSLTRRRRELACG